MRRSNLFETTLGFIFSWNSEFVKSKFIKLEIKHNRLSCDIINRQYTNSGARLTNLLESKIGRFPDVSYLPLVWCMVYILHFATQTWLKGVQNCSDKREWIVVEVRWTSDGSESGVFVQTMIREYSQIIRSRRSDNFYWRIFKTVLLFYKDRKNWIKVNVIVFFFLLLSLFDAKVLSRLSIVS